MELGQVVLCDETAFVADEFSDLLADVATIELIARGFDGCGSSTAAGGALDRDQTAKCLGLIALIEYVAGLRRLAVDEVDGRSRGPTPYRVDLLGDVAVERRVDLIAALTQLNRGSDDLFEAELAVARQRGHP